MSKLEQLTPNAAVRGILPDGLVTVVSVQWFGSEALSAGRARPAILEDESGGIADGLPMRVGMVQAAL